MTAIDTALLGGATATAPTASAPTLVHLSGDIDIFSTAQLRQRLLKTLNYSTDPLVLDLSRVTFCGVGGLGVLIGVQGRARARGITLALTGVPPRVARLLHITGLDRRFPIVA
ncbi:STAS domain-containing protein [Nonomuraea aurantiaca]|jgi:anti-sigma B factor antagonist|uniref:STAS domain-containing protein n=1 Tax=Nonomuraea aurantiaca TaxID=2878562 RepID=UPI001CD9DC47|nr:STAS domain-containing protein [Nonomuraea aurantiaca]MCA2224980.1 STAS domain-containing protein [Nonomuraea aurantiaca]